MNIKIIQERLTSYNCESETEEQHAIREITQDLILAALGRSDFFKHALFHGGTCLRIFYGLNRFSEDMDFMLRKPDATFDLKHHIRHLTTELAAYGYDVQIVDRSKTTSTVRKAFIKDNSLGKVIKLNHRNTTGKMAMIRIKLEVDTNPPSGSKEELKYLDFPFLSAVSIQDKPSLFAGKAHALLCRNYIKGRDWYDFIWYISNSTEVNYQLLSSALFQIGPWQQRDINVDKKWLTKELTKKITSIDWNKAAKDVRRFLRIGEQPSLKLWSKELFLHELNKLS